MATLELRPLGLGELLDRAVTLYVRNFGALTLAVVVPYLPLVVAQYVLLGDLLIRRPASLGARDWTSFAFVMVIGSVAFAYARTAAVAVAHGRYTGQEVSLASGLRLGFSRLGAQLVLAFVGLICATALTLALIIPVLAVTLIATAGGGAGTVPILVTFGIMVVVGAALFLWLGVAFELATVRVALRKVNPFTILFASLGATALRKPWRSLLVGLVVLLLAGALSAIFSELGDVMPTPALHIFVAVGIGGAGTTLSEALTVAFLVAYDVDLAVRHEGLDLAMALDRTASL